MKPKIISSQKANVIAVREKHVVVTSGVTLNYCELKKLNLPPDQLHYWFWTNTLDNMKPLNRSHK